MAERYQEKTGLERAKALRDLLSGFYQKDDPSLITPINFIQIRDLRTLFPKVEISEAAKIGLENSQFRGLESPKFKALAEVIGEQEAERMVDYALLLGLSCDWYRIGNPGVPLTQGRGLMQLGADFVAAVYLGSNDMGLNKRLYLSAKKTAGSKNLSAIASIENNFADIEKPKKPKLVATYPTNVSGKLLDFIANGCSEEDLLLQAQKTFEDLSNRQYTNRNERKLELASIILIIAHSTRNFSSVRTQLDNLLKLNSCLNLEDEKDQKIALAIKKQIKRYSPLLQKVGSMPIHISRYLEYFEQSVEDDD